MGIFIKIISSILIILSCGGIGIKKAISLKYRADSLLDLKNAFLILESEISFAANKLFNATANAGQGIGGAVGAFLTDMSRSINSLGAKKAWESSLNKHKHKMCLTDADIKLLLPIGSELGVTDIQNQISQLRHTSDLVHTQYLKAQSNYDSSGKIYAGIGMLSGLAVTIIFF